MKRHRTNHERFEMVKEYKVSKLSVSEFARSKGVSRTSLRDWINAFDNIDGSFVRLNKNLDKPGDQIVLSNDETTIKMLTTEQIYKKSHRFTRFDHSVVLLEFGQIKITTSLEQALAIMEKYYDRFI